MGSFRRPSHGNHPPHHQDLKVDHVHPDPHNHHGIVITVIVNAAAMPMAVEGVATVHGAL